MSNDKDKIARAELILRKYRIPEIAGELMTNSYRFKSLAEVVIDCAPKRDYLNDSGLVKTALIQYLTHELVVGTTAFRDSYLPDDDDLWADGMIFFDGTLVLKVSAMQSCDDYGSESINFIPVPELMKADKGLELRATSFRLLEEDAEHREKLRKAELNRRIAQEIDLGDF